jgi:hypothetical protein
MMTISKSLEHSKVIFKIIFLPNDFYQGIDKLGRFYPGSVANEYRRSTSGLLPVLILT